MNKPAVSKIISTIGEDVLRARTGLSDHAIRHAKTTGAFAAGWFDELERMCVEAGVPCPRSAFNWKSPSSDAAPSDRRAG